MVELRVPEVDYTEYSNRQLLVVPLAVLALALLIIGGWFLLTGAPANYGLEFTGGTEVRIAMDDVEDPDAAIEEAFSAEPDTIRSIPGDDVYVVTFRAGVTDASTLEDEVEAAGFDLRGLDEVSESFGADTRQLAVTGVGIAFLGMAVLVFALFRTFIPSVAVVASAFSDIMIPIAMMNLLGIDLTLGTVAALLMLIGYSVDSDILLNNSVLRRTGDFYESVHRAMRTGVTMTITSIAAMTVMAIAATILGVDLLRDIGIILVVGLFADLMNTYLMNVTLLRWYKFEGVKR
ncbi:preprotein translocase subunit SecF [Halalkaliarchaeum desulfuricum]|uniref:Protein-export membrane protein SecF n=1 Tax=Halalkaliarchaeum desulfuricum TaxID=2055893 RepID=A0A343THA1_9EURY|nr:protein translocase subunit SecF [Halalkaliarchaeum desulfuricum]AUX08473.1 preprotein translocase subunit SecF [Halalkaliarchaeum desulfuricum]